MLDGSTGFKFKTENIGVMFAPRSKRSKDPKINMILRKIALLETTVPGLVATAEHSFGVANIWPDILSRLKAPDACDVPEQLALVERFATTSRGTQFWIAN